MPSNTLYDKLAPIYELLSAPEAGVRQAALDTLAPQPGERILEIGCGLGQVLTRIATASGPSGKAVGLDLSMAMCRRGARRLERNRTHNAFIVCADARQLPAQPDAYDAALSVLTLETLPPADVAPTLVRLRQTVVSDGRLVVASMGVGQHLIHHLYTWAHRAMPQIVDCRPMRMAHDLDEAGWNVQRVTQRSLVGLTIDITVAHSAP